MTAARLNGGGLAQRHVAERPERQNRHRQRERSEDREHAAPAEQVADDAGDRSAQHIGGERDAEQPRDRDLALMDRHEIAEQRHRHRKHAARHEAGDDPHGDQQREARRDRADQRGERHHQHAGVHQPGLAEEVAGDAQHRLDQRIGKGEGGRQQRRRLHVDARDRRRSCGMTGSTARVKIVWAKTTRATILKMGGMARLASLLQLLARRSNSISRRSSAFHLLERHHVRPVGRRAGRGPGGSR